MVSTTQAVHPPVRHPGSGRIRAIARHILAVFDSAGLVLKAAHEYERLSLLPDRHLAEQGLSRQTLPQQVFAAYLRH
jgi:hypothetical protein